MEKYDEKSRKMETLAMYIRNIYLFEERHTEDQEIKFICDFCDNMVKNKDIKLIDNKYKSFLEEYMEKIDIDFLTKIGFTKDIKDTK